MSKLLVFLILLVHGIGHLQGVVVSLGFKDFGKWHANSWLFGKWLPGSTQNIICLLFFVLTSLLALATALCFKEILFTNFSWKILGLWAASLSSISIVLFPHAFAMFFNYIGAIVVNLGLFYTVFISDAWLDKLN